MSLALTRLPPVQVTVIPKRPFLVSDGEATFSLYAKPELMLRAMGLRKKKDKNVKLTQRRYKHLHDRPVRCTPIFKEGHDTYLDKLSLFCFAARTTAIGEYGELLPKKQGPCTVVAERYKRICIVRDGLEHIVSIHLATLAAVSTRYCDKFD